MTMASSLHKKAKSYLRGTLLPDRDGSALCHAQESIKTQPPALCPPLLMGNICSGGSIQRSPALCTPPGGGSRTQTSYLEEPIYTLTLAILGCSRRQCGE